MSAAVLGAPSAELPRPGRVSRRVELDRLDVDDLCRRVHFANGPHGALDAVHDGDDHGRPTVVPSRYGGHIPRSPQNDAVTSGSFSGV